MPTISQQPLSRQNRAAPVCSIPAMSPLSVKEPVPLISEFSQQAEKEWLQTLKRLIADRSQRSAELKSTYQTQRRSDVRAYQEARNLVLSALETEQSQLEAAHQRAYEEAQRLWQQRIHEAEQAHQQATEDVESHYQTEFQAAKTSRDETTWLVGSLLDDHSTDSPRQKLQKLHAQIDGVETILQEAVRKVELTREEAADYLVRCRMSTEVGLIEPSPAPTTLTGLQERCLAEVELAEQPSRRLRSLWLPRCFAGVTPFFLWLLMGGLLAVAGWSFISPEMLGMNVQPRDYGWMAIFAGSGAAIALVTLLLLHSLANQRCFDLITDIFTHSRAAQALFARWERVAAEELARAQEQLEHRHLRQKQQREEAIQKADSELAERQRELVVWRRQEVERFNTQAAEQLQQLTNGRDQQLNFLALSATHEQSEFEEQRKAQISELETTHTQRLHDLDADFQQNWEQLRQNWLTGIQELTATAQRWMEDSDRLSPSFFSPQRPSAVEVGHRLKLGTIDVPLNEFPDGKASEDDLQIEVDRWQLPAEVDLRQRPALLVQYRGMMGRREAVDLLQAAALRLLLMMPPGQVRLTILDPVSLGENFATFMHLADADELLITSRIWTEPGQIEERLADLTEHMETVLQMFLRSEFATLADYNREAGEVAEPYRVLIVSGLPSQFSEIALRRLWNIVSGGGRCGVIPLMAMDVQAPWPRGFSQDELAAMCHVVSCVENPPAWVEAELKEWPFRPEPLPDPATLTRLIKDIGVQAGDVRRVQVPFARVAPAAEAFWSGSTAQKLEVPIGRAGASRTQSVTLGQGTSQHVLIAGKTGSGKSTLLHALITNAALIYSPEELQLYLVDFKKGVEFKVYAKHRLPHAAVIGIESDREFGVATLERLDRELQERSSLFRDAGVANLAGFRRERPAVAMPRILLIIDEFQEFFVDDDPLAQTAALLLDRLIRQGRAFGVHVILGSQTLAGAYSLARSTLGQVAVRIALQCSESDAHLVLSEENSAARLLTRPGEAIYNDANGLASGNHLFQVVWLEDEERDRYLEQVLHKSREQAPANMVLPRPATIVFEGNIPADFQQLPQSETVTTSPTAPVTAWLGEAVSLRGPLGLNFTPTAGSHLLVVGQDESSAAGILLATALSVGQQIQFEGESATPSVLVFNGSPSEHVQESWVELSRSRPQIALRDAKDLETELANLVAELKERDGRPGPGRWLYLCDLVRFRKLRRNEDDFGFSGFDKKTASPSDLLAELLRDGPSVGIHVCVWCDSVNTIGRWLSREMQQHLENRIALPMNANDSSQFIDSPVASRLGVNRAWLFQGDRGTLDKFRPYALPRPAQIRARLTRE